MMLLRKYYLLRCQNAVEKNLDGHRSWLIMVHIKISREKKKIHGLKLNRLPGTAC